MSSNIFSQEIVRLYKGKAPGSEDWNYKEIELMSPYNSPARSFRNVVDPTLEVFRPEKSKISGTAVIVCPGGGNYYLEYEKEGTTVAEWLAKNGITAFVLKYRLNKTPEDPKDFQEYQDNMDARMNAPRTGTDSPGRPVQTRNYGGEDGIRAVEYVRENAKEFNISPDKVGIIGFSAGAGVTMHAVMNSMPGKRRILQDLFMAAESEAKRSRKMHLFVYCRCSGRPDCCRSARFI
jgi:acetyl esterase/lipase